MDAYTAYAKVLKYAQGVGIRVVHKDDSDDGDGVYMQSRSKIVIDSENHIHIMLYALLHELGHHLSDQFYERRVGSELDKAYKRCYTNKKMSRLHQNLVVACERRAWDHGEIIAKMLKIKLGKAYKRYRYENLRTYKENNK